MECLKLNNWDGKKLLGVNEIERKYIFKWIILNYMVINLISNNKNMIYFIVKYIDIDIHL